MPPLKYWTSRSRANLDHIDPGNAGGSVVIPESPKFVQPPRAPGFVCTQCRARFFTSDELFEHRFEMHPLRRPVLILDGHELLTPIHVIRKRLSPEGIALGNVSQCWINGELVPPNLAATHISAFGNALLSIRLESRDGPVESSYEIDISVPEPEHVAEVERRFVELAAGGELDLGAIERFIRTTQNEKSALGFVDAVSQYLFGVLAKDQRGGTHLTQEEGRSRFNQALQGLIGFECGLATILTEVINFSQNAFSDGTMLDAVPELQAAMRRFYGILHPEMAPLPVRPAIGHGAASIQVPLDTATDKIITWAGLFDAALFDQVAEMSIALELDTWVPDDRFKVRVLLSYAMVAAGELQRASEHARRLRNDTFFADWAETIIERSKGI